MGFVRLPRARPGDFVAGLSVGLVVIPQSLAYSQVAGLPPVRGLYAAAFPSIAAAPFASSRHLQTGPVGVTALLTFGGLSSLAVPGTTKYVALAMLLALVVGAIRVGVGALRLGSLAYMLSPPLLAGFMPAAGLLIAASQSRRRTVTAASAICGGHSAIQAAGVRRQWYWRPSRHC